MAIQIGRRGFLAALGGAAALPVAARAQQADRMWRIGVLVSRAADDPQGQVRLGAFQQALQQLGWSDGRGSTSAGASTMPTERADARRN